jgi:site-specific recombinase XerC
VFHELQPAVVDALNEISTWKGTETSALANQLSSYIHQLRFQVALLILRVVKVFAITAPLSKFLPTKKLDLEFALEFADMTQSTIKQIRDNANVEFDNIFKNFEDVCSSFCITASVPRTTSR